MVTLTNQEIRVLKLLVGRAQEEEVRMRELWFLLGGLSAAEAVKAGPLTLLLSKLTKLQAEAEVG